MTIKEIVASIMALGKKVDVLAADKTTATDSALSALAGEISTLKTSTVSLLETAQTDLATAKEANKIAVSNAEKEKGEKDGILSALKASCETLKLEVKEGATATDMISQMQGAVTATLAKLQVDATRVPAAVPTTTSPSPTGAKKSLDQQCKEAKAAQPTK